MAGDARLERATSGSGDHRLVFTSTYLTVLKSIDN